MSIFTDNAQTIIVAVVLVLVVGYLIKSRKRKKDERKDFWRGWSYKQDPGTAIGKNKFADAMLYIKKKNPALYDQIDRKLAAVEILNRKSKTNPAAVMDAQAQLKRIRVYKTMWGLFTSRRDWCYTILHEFGHLEGLPHGAELDRRTVQRMKSIGYR